MKKRKRSGSRKAWIPMRRGEPNPAYMNAVYPDGMPEGVIGVEVWGNDTYEATVENFRDGLSYITLKRRDRKAVRDWRHLQSIKNEVCGPEREAIELFPAESRLMDTSNQYHLWVLPLGSQVEIGNRERQVLEAHVFNEGRVKGEHRGRQRPWQPGLSTGPEVSQEGILGKL